MAIETIKIEKVTCDVCGKTTLCVSVCGAYGPVSYSICQNCLIQGKEPYNLIVDYISLAGRYPQDINETYREAVKEQLILHEKTEEEFSRVDDCIIFYDDVVEEETREEVSVNG